MATRRKGATFDGPWWIEAGVKFGIMTLLAGWLLWKQDATIQKLSGDIVALNSHLQAESEQGWMMVGILSRTCINTSKTDADRLACVSVPRRQGQ